MLLPFMPYAKGLIVTIKPQMILGECEIEDGLVNEYKRLFWPNELQVPTKPTIIK